MAKVIIFIFFEALTSLAWWTWEPIAISWILWLASLTSARSLSRGTKIENSEEGCPEGLAEYCQWGHKNSHWFKPQVHHVLILEYLYEDISLMLKFHILRSILMRFWPCWAQNKQDRKNSKSKLTKYNFSLLQIEVQCLLAISYVQYLIHLTKYTISADDVSFISFCVFASVHILK